jgi:hypothetical protein
VRPQQPQRSRGEVEILGKRAEEVEAERLARKQIDPQPRPGQQRPALPSCGDGGLDLALGRGGQVVGQRWRLAVGRGETGPERGVAVKAGRDALALAPQRLRQPGALLPGVVAGDEGMVRLEDLAINHDVSRAHGSCLHDLGRPGVPGTSRLKDRAPRAMLETCG